MAVFNLPEIRELDKRRDSAESSGEAYVLSGFRTMEQFQFQGYPAEAVPTYRFHFYLLFPASDGKPVKILLFKF